jgi:thymidylate synthase (FAD)
MGKLVEPQTYLVGYTTMDGGGMEGYLRDSGNLDFWETISQAHDSGLSYGEILCSFYAKVCYAALTVGHNDNITRVRDIPDNLRACFDQGHSSVFEHCQLNFITRNCSRVFTHEICRHRAGTAFSQTSGRYVRGDEVNIVFDPILEPVRDDVETLQYLIEERYRLMVRKMGLDTMTDFTKKKQATSALRRLLPNGQSNEIGWSVNLRSLRHMVQLRTNRQAEWEIRLVFGQVYRLVKDNFPLVFHGAMEEQINGLLEVSGMKMQPYEKT